MQLKFVGEHISIRQFDSVELPEFTILTGRNGSGKTHLLQAIDSGNCQIDNFRSDEIQYFNFQSFFVSSNQGQVPNQIQQLSNQGFTEFHQNWLPPIKTLFGSLSSPWKPTFSYPDAASFYNSVEDFWNFKPRGKAIQSHVNEYREKLTLWLTDTVGLPKGSQHPAIWSLIQKSSKPPHVIDQETFYEVFSPVQNSGSILGFSLSTIFSKYIIDEFNWCHNQFEAGRSASKAKSRAIFRKKFQPPWVPINKLLDEMGKMSASREAFRFEITTPDEEHIKIQSIQGYSFVANLRNKISGDICNFDNLSSGEKVLLALVISIYYSNESFMLPKVLLLDEVDASLHPSMIRVLLDAIGRAFVSKGTKVIMATHSPTTVALAPEGALHSVQTGNRQKKIVKISKNEGLSILTEGFATFDEGLEALSFSGDRVIIFTEGSNRKILNRYFNISGLDNIKFIDRLDDKSSKDQLVHYYKLISAIGLNKKILFIWDCDAERQVANLEETEGLFKYVIPRNLNNKIASAGIENAFDEDLLSPHCKRIIDPDGSESLRFDNAEKKRFTEKMAKSEDLASFHRFAGLGDKVRQILSL